ncbi:hypothetical protein [Erwinia sp. CGal63]|uniref:hypothetical protein n=1 Tax=Erwinia sp. CGal63 TaxID=2919889 RepID=UPI00300B11C8
MPSSQAMSELSPTQKAFFAMNRMLQERGWALAQRKLASGEYVEIDGKYYTAAELRKAATK